VSARLLITLLSDFGAASSYPAQMKGVLLTAAPDATLVDLSHDVAPYDVLAGALMLEACAPRFPGHAVHLAVVDPGVGTARRPLCVVDAAGRRFVGPDNGLFTPFLGAGARAIHLTSRDVVPDPVSATFHGRDLFAPVAAWLASGGDASWLGPAVADPVRLPWPRAERRGAEVHGECLAADPFGNVLTTIRAGDLGLRPREVLVGDRAARFVQTYGHGAAGEPIALLGSSGRLEIAVREGNAWRQLGLTRGAPIVVRVA